MTPFAYTDEQQIDELLDEIEAVEIFEDLDDLLAQIRLEN